MSMSSSASRIFGITARFRLKAGPLHSISPMAGKHEVKVAPLGRSALDNSRWRTLGIVIRLPDR
jgi:hypothetical protein